MVDVVKLTGICLRFEVLVDVVKLAGIGLRFKVFI